MYEVESELNFSQGGVLDANGKLQILGVGPTRSGERWVITGIATAVDAGTTDSASTEQARFCIYRGTSLTTMVDGTYSGNADRSDTEHRLFAGECLSFWWMDGEVGARAQVTITGKRYLRRG